MINQLTIPEILSLLFLCTSVVGVVVLSILAALILLTES